MIQVIISFLPRRKTKQIRGRAVRVSWSQWPSNTFTEWSWWFSVISDGLHWRGNIILGGFQCLQDISMLLFKAMLQKRNQKKILRTPLSVMWWKTRKRKSQSWGRSYHWLSTSSRGPSCYKVISITIYMEMSSSLLHTFYI